MSDNHNDGFRWTKVIYYGFGWLMVNTFTRDQRYTVLLFFYYFKLVLKITSTGIQIQIYL